MLERFQQDFRFAFRSLVRNPGFAVIVALIFALGIGANAAVFTVVNSVILAPLPYPEPDKLVQIFGVYEGGGEANHSATSFGFLENHLDRFEIAATGGSSGSNLIHSAGATFIRNLLVSADYLRVLDVAPALGRGFEAQDDLPGAVNVAVLTHGLWGNQFGADPEILGEVIKLGDVSYTVVGVMPEDFVPIPRADLLIPLKAKTNVRGAGTNYSVIGRLPDMSLLEANQLLDQLGSAFKRQYPDAESFSTFRARPYQEVLSSGVRNSLLFLMAVVGAVLIIACANISGLLLARATSRRKEAAIRAALGGGRRRIMRQFVMESLLLSLAGGAVGLMVVPGTLTGILSVAPGWMFLWNRPEVDLSVLITMLGIAVLAGILSGVVPALQASRVEVANVLQESSSRGASSRTGTDIRRILVVSQIAISVVLLVGAGLLIRTFLNLRTLDLGFDTRNIVTVQMAMQGNRYQNAAALNQFYTRVLERIQELPGVRAAAVGNNLPIERGLNLPVQLETEEGRDIQSVDWRYVSPEYFEVMGIPLLKGRLPGPNDRSGSVAVAVVDEEFARRYFSDEDPLNQVVYAHPMGAISDQDRRVVGVVGSVVTGGLGGQPQPTVYVPLAQVASSLLEIIHSFFQSTFIIRTDPEGITVSPIREAVRSVDPDQPFSAFKSIEEVMIGTVESERFQMILVSLFAIIALAMAIAGIYGLIAYMVLQRNREMAIRLVLGATLRRVVAHVVAEGLILAVIGIAIGMLLAVGLGRFLQGFLYDVTAIDPLTFLTVGILILLAGGLASLIPSLRFSRMSLTKALRQE